MDYFGELVQDNDTADLMADGYLQLSDDLAGSPRAICLAVDLSHIGLDVDQQRCTARLLTIAGQLPDSESGHPVRPTRSTRPTVQANSGQDWFRYWMRRLAESRGV